MCTTLIGVVGDIENTTSVSGDITHLENPSTPSWGRLPVRGMSCKRYKIESVLDLVRGHMVINLDKVGDRLQISAILGLKFGRNLDMS